MLEQKCKKHWITFTNTYAGTVVLEQSEQFEICSDIPTIDIVIHICSHSYRICYLVDIDIVIV